MKKTRILLAIVIASSLIGCNNSQKKIEPIPKDVSQVENKRQLEVESTQEIINQENNIGEAKAKEIALSEVPSGVIIECSFDYDSYSPNYDILISDSTYEYNFEINALDGSIVERERKSI